MNKGRMIAHNPQTLAAEQNVDEKPKVLRRKLEDEIESSFSR